MKSWGKQATRVVSMVIAVLMLVTLTGPFSAQAAATDPVKLRETGDSYATLSAGIAAAATAGYTTYTLEVAGDVTEAKSVIITSNVTIVGADGAHTIALPSASSLKVQSGGALVLGDGSSANLLTITSPSDVVSVTDGSIKVNEGVKLKGYDALSLSGAAAKGTITGGIFEGSDLAVDIAGKATIDEISGGTFSGAIDALHLSDAGTKIARISGGSFYQTSLTTTLHGHAVFVQNEARIDEISGGRFEAALNSALVVIRGAWVSEISGGEFLANRVGTLAASDRNATVWVEGDTTTTGIGTISGGSYSGAYFGMLLIQRNTPVRVDTISGGAFAGVVALQSDRGSSIGDITGGTFTGSQGIFNVGVITTIGGTAAIVGNSSYGVFNYAGGQIAEITGAATITGENYAIMNAGAIGLISGATLIGGQSAINSDGLNKGTLETISGGVFWGKADVAIRLSSPLQLEPGLDASKGIGRFWGEGGVIFNDESLVVYPVHELKGPYFMSEETLSVPGIDAVGFKYLRLPLVEYRVEIRDAWLDAQPDGEGAYEEGELVRIHTGAHAGYDFAGWVTQDGDVILSDPATTTATFLMPDHDVTITALWTPVSTGDPEDPGDEPVLPEHKDPSQDTTAISVPEAKKPVASVPKASSLLPETRDAGVFFLPFVASALAVALAGITLTGRKKSRRT